MDKRNKKIISLLLIPLLFACLIAGVFTYNSTSKSPQLTVYANAGIVNLVTGDFNSAAVKSDADVLDVLDKLKSTYGYQNAESELRLNKILDTAVGKVYRFDQIKKGLVVFGRGLNVSVNNKGEVLSISGNYLKGIKISTATVFSVDAAVQVIFDTYEDAIINSVDLEIYSLNDTTPQLAYNIVAAFSDTLTRVFVSASTGKIIEEIPLESNHMPPGYNSTNISTTQKDYYGDNKSVNIEKQGANYFLNDVYRNIILYNCENTGNAKNYFYNTSPVFNNGYAVTALLNTVKAFDFYTDANNIGVSISGVDDSVDGTHVNQEAFILVYLHYGEEVQNAYCSFDPNHIDDNYGKFMGLFFGDGHPSGIHNTAVAADIVGHEYQHAVTAYTAGLIYLNASGALNEAYSDIFGALIEDHDQTDDRFWNSGEDATSDKLGLRSMKNPSYYNYPDHMDKAYPMDGNYDWGGVHFNSAIITHAQYKMYEALPSHFTKQNIGKLWYTALTMLSPDSDFPDFKIIMRQAGAQLGWDESVLTVMDEAFESCGIMGSDGEHTITFNKGDLTGDAPAVITADYGDTFTISECDLTAPRAKLVGWSETGNYKSTVYNIGEEYDMPAYDLTLYPVLEREIWNGIEPTVLSGHGTEASPYLISSAEDLATFAYFVNNDVEKPWVTGARPWFLMTSDIDLNNIPWIPIGIASTDPDAPEPEPSAERTNFDGGGHVIKNLKIYYENPERFVFQGLFGGIGDINIMRLGIESGSIETAAVYVGAIAGGLRDASITDCFSKIKVNNGTSMMSVLGQATYGSAGGLVGYIKRTGSVTNCRNFGDISGYYAGGICAVQYDEIEFSACNNKGSVSAIAMGGGIIGFSTLLNAKNCINTGEIAGRRSYIGGICGMLYAELNAKPDIQSLVIGCKNTGVLTGWFCGALIGMINGKCSILLEKNHYKAQDSISYLSNLDSIVDNLSLSSDVPVCSDDEIGVGDFAFNNSLYFFDSEYFDDISDESAIYLYFSFNTEKYFTVTWIIEGETETEQYELGDMPEYKDATPVKEGNAEFGYSFTGWTPAISMVKGNVTYTAQFSQSVNDYTITFMSDGQILDTQTANYGDKLTELPNPTKDGYEFKGWYKDESYSAVFDKDTDTIISDTTLYAKWEEANTGGCGCGNIDLPSGISILFTLLPIAAICFAKSRRQKNLN